MRWVGKIGKHFIAKGMSRAQRMRKCSRGKDLQKDRIKFYYTLKKSKLYPCRTKYFHILQINCVRNIRFGKVHQHLKVWGDFQSKSVYVWVF